MANYAELLRIDKEGGDGDGNVHQEKRGSLFQPTTVLSVLTVLCLFLW